MDTSKPSGDFAVQSSVNEQLPATMNANLLSSLVGGSQIEPKGIQARSAAPLQVLPDAISLSVVVPSGQSGLFSSILASSNGEVIKQFVTSQLYVGTLTLTNRTPEVVSSLTYPTQEWSVPGNVGTDVYCRQIRNASGATQTFLIDASVTYLVNRTDNATLTTSFVVAP